MGEDEQTRESRWKRLGVYLGSKTRGDTVRNVKCGKRGGNTNGDGKKGRRTVKINGKKR